MAERRLGVVRRTDLKDVAPGWEDCFLIYRPASLGELAESQEQHPEKMTEKEGIDFMLTFIKRHVVSGQVMTLDEADQLVSGKLENADIDYFPADVLNRLFADITGAQLDPKDTPPAQTLAPAPQTDAPPTETPSSTDSSQSPEISATTLLSSGTASDSISATNS